MKLLANENFPLASVQYLREHGFDVAAIGIDKAGISDTEVLSIAIEESRTIVTFDRDYGELIFKNNPRPEKGVIYLRLVDYTPSDPGQLVNDLFKMEGFIPDNTLTVLSRDSIRQRKY